MRGARWTKVAPNHRSSIFVLSDTDLSIPFVFKTRVKSQPSKIDLIVGKTFESISRPPEKRSVKWMLRISRMISMFEYLSP